jgi:hypothetical protein
MVELFCVEKKHLVLIKKNQNNLFYKLKSKLNNKNTSNSQNNQTNKIMKNKLKIISMALNLIIGKENFKILKTNSKL